MNVVILAGYLGGDPELTYTQGGTAICKFSMATSKSYKNRDGEKIEETQWHRVIVWGTKGENVAKCISKGSHVMVNGELRTRSWEDDGGNKRYVTEVYANFVEFGPKSGGKKSGGGSGGGNGGGQGGKQRNRQNGNRNDHGRGNDQSGGPPDDDDIPF
jgi:single-strand DNA-binding protein